MPEVKLKDVGEALVEQYGDPDIAEQTLNDVLATLTSSTQALRHAEPNVVVQVSVTIHTVNADFLITTSNGEHFLVELKESGGRPLSKKVHKGRSTRSGKFVSKKSKKKNKKVTDDDAAPSPSRPGRTDSPGPSANHDRGDRR